MWCLARPGISSTEQALKICSDVKWCQATGLFHQGVLPSATGNLFCLLSSDCTTPPHLLPVLTVLTAVWAASPVTINDAVSAPGEDCWALYNDAAVYAWNFHLGFSNVRFSLVNHIVWTFADSSFMFFFFLSFYTFQCCCSTVLTGWIDVWKYETTDQRPNERTITTKWWQN